MASEDSLYIGLMSGTSLDGVDGVLLRFAADPAPPSSPASSAAQAAAVHDADVPIADVPMQVLGHANRGMPAALRRELLALNSPGDNELHRAALAANALADLQADVVSQLLRAHGIEAPAVTAVGSHGQTVRHRPGEFDATGYTLQLNNGALLAERCGIDVICDFRSRDVAAHGQGAPLVPAFHATVFGLPDRPRAVLNLGGIGNLTLLPAGSTVGGVVRGFDSGPGNALLDHWAQTHLGQPFDADGHWSAGGRVDAGLLAALLDEPFLRQPPPKSTGRDLFNAAWLQLRLDAGFAGLTPQDVQATLAEFTARAAADALREHAAGMAISELLVCGGGALNADLMRRLALALPAVSVRRSDEVGLPALQVEAAAFAWLAHAFVQRAAGNRAEVTGARGPRVLGALYPAG